jgi:hypothetical protein
MQYLVQMKIVAQARPASLEAEAALFNEQSDRPHERTERKKVMSKEVRKTAIPHEVVRLDVAVHQTYDKFCQRFEGAVPMWNRARAVELVERKAPWSEVVADVTASAPHDFLLYWKMDVTPIMNLAGNTGRSTEYLIGNHVIAETMYRHDPSVALYVPLRCAIYEADGGARFAIDQPSTTLSSLGRDEITQVGIDLDRKLARLLGALGVEVPAVLSPSQMAA